MSISHLPFGLASDGRMVSIDTVIRGLACDCVCSECGSQLIAAKGEQNRHHFRHHASLDCIRGTETAIHKFAKQIICDELELTLPNSLGPMRSAFLEEWLDGIRPDVFARYDAEPVAIEIYVTHKVPSEKLSKIVDRQLATIEIDLSDYRDREMSLEAWKRAVLYRAPRAWLFPPLHVRLEVERQERERLEAATRQAALLAEAAIIEAEQRERERLEAAIRDAETRQQSDERRERERQEAVIRAAELRARQELREAKHLDAVTLAISFREDERRRNTERLAVAKRNKDDRAIQYWSRELAAHRTIPYSDASVARARQRLAGS